jgi:hypothetical protein
MTTDLFTPPVEGPPQSTPPPAPDAPPGPGWTDVSINLGNYFGRVGVGLFLASADTAADLEACRDLVVAPLLEEVRKALAGMPEKQRFNNFSRWDSDARERLGRAEADLRRLRAEREWKIAEGAEGLPAELARLDAAVAAAEGTRAEVATQKESLKPLLEDATHRAGNAARALARRAGPEAVARVRAALDDALEAARAALPAALAARLKKIARLWATLETADDLDFEGLCLHLAFARDRDAAPGAAGEVEK